MKLKDALKLELIGFASATLELLASFRFLKRDKRFIHSSYKIIADLEA